MILAIDIGNTNVKFGIYRDGKLIASFRYASNVNKTADEYGANVRDRFLSEGLKVEDVEGVIMSSVIPSLNYTFDHMCRYYFEKSPISVSSKLDCGLKIRYDNPKDLGSDRIATSVAAIHKYGAPLIVVDFGTATTFNVINAQGEFEGGMICPGVRSAMNSLVTATAKLPKIEIVVPERVIGKSTVENMQSGIYYGTLGQVEYILSKIRSQSGLAHAKVIATGGFSELLREATDLFDHVDRKLSLEGLYLIYQRVSAQSQA